MKPSNSSLFSFRLPQSGALTLDRLKGLSDGIVSIVLTILIFGIEVPKGHNFATDGLWSFVMKFEYQMTVYAVSFVLIAGYWVQHNVMFHYFRNASRGLTWLNLLFMLLLTLLPFMTQVIGTYRDEPRVMVLYGIVNIACGCSLGFMWWAANRLMPVVWPRIDPAVSRSMFRRIMLGPVITVVAIGVAFFHVRLSHFVLMSTPFLQLSHRRVDSHWMEVQDEDSTAAE